MSIGLNPEQENFVQSKIQARKMYYSFGLTKICLGFATFYNHSSCEPWAR